MKWYSETTTYTDSMPNGTYLLNDSKTKLYAYVAPGTGTPKQFKNPIKIEMLWSKQRVIIDWRTDNPFLLNRCER